MKEFLGKMIVQFLNVLDIRGAAAEYFRNRQNIILVYTMGKVGSSTVYATLREHLPRTDVFHSHFLSDRWLLEVLPNEHEYFHRNIAEGKKIREYIGLNPRKRIKVITLVREPVEREISDLFQNPVPAYETDDLTTVNTGELVEKLKSNDFLYPHSWFDTEFREFTGIDIYKLPFDNRKGFIIHRSGRFDVLCIKLEQLESCYREAFRLFLNLQVEKLSPANETKDKKSHLRYKEVKGSLKLHPAKLSQVYGSPYSRHFYSQEEISRYMSRWMES